MTNNKKDNQIAEYVHHAPVWRDKADFIIGVDVSENKDGSEMEQLWARRIEEYLFEICCIPFFANDLSLGDLVHTTEDYLVTSVAQHSDYFVFRIWFGSMVLEHRELCLKSMEQFLSLIEWSSDNLLAVAISGEDRAGILSADLVRAEKNFGITFETGRS